MAKRKSTSIPFDPARPQTAPFAGRNNLIQQLCTGLRDGRSFQLYGPPKIGKTCLLNRVAEKLAASSQRLLTVHVTLERAMSRHGDIVKTVLQTTLDALHARSGGKISTSPGDHVTQLDGSDAMRNGLNTLLKRGNGPSCVALLVDGLHRIEPSLAAQLSDTLYGIVNRNEAQLVWCGRERLRHEQRNDVSPLSSLFSQHILLEPLSLAETEELISLAKQHGVMVERGFASKLYQITNGHPYRLQYYMHAVLANNNHATVDALCEIHTTDTVGLLNDVTACPASAASRRPTAQQPSIFVSYSHENEEEKRQLVAHLRVLESSGFAVTWVDDQLAPGSGWQEKIIERIDAAAIAVLMISAPFLEPGGFILKTELPRILERQKLGGLRVVPVVARQCDWQSHEQIRQLALLPKNAAPLWHDGVKQPDERLTDVVQQVRKLLAGQATE